MRRLRKELEETLFQLTSKVNSQMIKYLSYSFIKFITVI